MSFRKFGDNDVFTNTMRAKPTVSFYIYEAAVYYNNYPEQSGVRNKAGFVGIPGRAAVSNSNTTKLTTVRNVQVGHINLYEYNIDRPLLLTDRIAGSPGLPATSSYSKLKTARENAGEVVDFVQDKSIIYPYITKNSSTTAWKTVNTRVLNTAFKYGDVLESSYPQSASISREYITEPFEDFQAYNAHYVALRNRLDFYGTRSPFYKVQSPGGNKDTQTLNLISIPSIFYGTRIDPGSMSLRFYITGSLIAELKDPKQNGELIQVGPAGSERSGSVAGVALYDEGMLLLTASWDLTLGDYNFGSGINATASWIYFAAGAHDGEVAGDISNEVSFDMSFKGHTETQTLTMFAHAGRGEANYSNNPTFIQHGQLRNEFTSSNIYEQRSDVLIKNIVSSSYSDFAAPFKRQLYISKVGVYDASKNLIALATLSNPILKKEEDNITFKLKLDI